VRGIRVIVGLGNPGARYERTRHNAGFLVMEKILAAGGGAWSRAGKGDSLRDEAQIRLGDRELLLARPLAFMNRSGVAVAELLAVHRIDPDEMLVVVDDVALPSGRLRLRAGGGAGGHNGLRSIRDQLGTGEHPRLRLGIGAPAPEVELAEYVLEPLAGAQWSELESVAAAAGRVVEVACIRGIVAAMDQFNPEDGGAGSVGPAA
jgi:peptidyl-tRNA hydrolase, PTH1 family